MFDYFILHSKSLLKSVILRKKKGGAFLEGGAKWKKYGMKIFIHLSVHSFTHLQKMFIHGGCIVGLLDLVLFVPFHSLMPHLAPPDSAGLSIFYLVIKLKYFHHSVNPIEWEQRET